VTAAHHDNEDDLLEQALDEVFPIEKPEPFVAPPVVPVEHRDETYRRRAANWCAKALSGRAERLAAMLPDSGRNVELNTSAFVLYRFALAGHLDVESVTDTMRNAAVESGLGTGETEGTLGSAYRAAWRHGPQEPPISGERRDPFDVTVDPATGEVVPSCTGVGGAAAVDEEAFWASREVLLRVRTFARARRCSPWAVLGVVLARVITVTPPFVVLPALVGSYASLNLFVALVGPSGGGKGASESAAADAVVLPDLEIATVGSGEGIGHLYAHREKGEVIRDRDAVLFTVPEVDNLVALANRQGATLLPQLRSAWSGERLGFAYADKNKALPIERHTYRMGLVLGVQPGRAGPLLDDADGGTPQRFLWMPTSDIDAPDEAPPAPSPWHWTPPPGPVTADVFGLTEMPIPEAARAEIAAQRLGRLRERGDALDGHALLTRLKAAAALALLDGRRAVSLEDWNLSETIMAVSDSTRAKVLSYLSAKAASVNKARGEAEGMRAVLVEERVADAAVQRVARRVVGLLEAGEISRSDVRRRLAARDRQHFDEAVERLLSAGQVEVFEDGERRCLRLSRP
jgi:hypothetical protein